MRSGQILILVLLIVVVILAVGLSVASRNITNLRTSTQTEQSQRAFTAAEGGVEDVLSRLNTIVTTNPEILSTGKTDIQVPVGDSGIVADVKVQTSNVYVNENISTGNVAQINLDGATVGEVQVEWKKSEGEQSLASLEIIQLYESLGQIQQERFYYQGEVGRANESGSFSATLPCTLTPGFEKCTKIAIQSGARMLRVKPFWDTTTIRVSGVGSGNFPVQTYEVSSTASTEIGVTRKVEVKRHAFEQLPSVFDYVLYSETDIIK